MQSDDRIVAAGFSTTEDATQTVVDEDVSLLRLRLDGTLDPDFGSGGKVLVAQPATFERANAVAIQPADGKIVVAGFRRTSGNEDFLVARVSADGTRDPSFGSGGIVTEMDALVAYLQVLGTMVDFADPANENLRQ